jgi:serine/threonine protein kinase
VGDPKRSIFCSSAIASGLVTQADLDEAAESVRRSSDGPPAPLVEIGDELLAQALVGQEKLTDYQAKQLLAGRTKLTLGPYVITDFIGQGGMGQVFKAEHQMMGRVTAIKVLPLHKSSPDAINNFSREIRAQAKLDHPNLVRAYDAGHDGNVHYLVTEYVPGTDLRQLVRMDGALSMQRGATVVQQAALALQHAHQSGLVHRDIKPGNILVTPEGIAKVSDLGLAGNLGGDEDDPRAGKIVGTADYLSPESIRSPNEIGPVSDIYSLGATLYYAVTGKVPFPGGNAKDKIRKHLEETPWHPRRFNPEISEEFVEVIADMMEKDPTERIQTAAEVAARLEPWVGEIERLSHKQLTKSPWTVPPVPIKTDAAGAAVHDTEALNDLMRESNDESLSQISQTTSRLAAASQETARVPRPAPPPLPLKQEGPPASAFPLIALVLAISAPIFMIVGAAFTAILIWLFG